MPTRRASSGTCTATATASRRTTCRHMWLNLAASRLTGERQETVARDRDNFADRMTPEDRSEAERRAREWAAAPPLEQ
jgi:hypothetical protein